MMPKQMRNAPTIVAAQNISFLLPPYRDFKGKEIFKWQGWDSIKEGSLDPSDNSQCIKASPHRQRFLRHKAPQQTPFLNLDPFQYWHWVKNVARVSINGESCMTLLDNGTQINTIMPKYEVITHCTWGQLPIS